MPTINRQHILDSITAALEPLDYVLAMWSGGADGFARVDEWSDLDLMVIAADDHVEDVFPVVETALKALSPIKIKYEIPQPAWHGHFQNFYTLQDASPFLMVDMAIIKESNPDNRFLESAIHGQPQVLFDKKDLIVIPEVNKEELLTTIEARLDDIRGRFELFQVLVTKELNRGNGIEAVSFYTNFTLRPLVELLRIKHCPLRYHYATRYVHYDLPPNVVTQLEPLFYPHDQADLNEKHAKAVEWANTILKEIVLEKIQNKLSVQ
ncbi:MAG: nucleotidyltransferase domain-containing protein [Chloroflexi bacterium]|nr:MAG: nucleotidyltransferase domain-containing protein [Chloroflexota bacterium]MBL1193923.1 nucleotidyltransferase domain-containing protein [Chloroflexota bacterium]NOH11217.1 nucleotidyltransferase domain-containing protein [Chloroflexota bacterium]